MPDNLPSVWVSGVSSGGLVGGGVKGVRIWRRVWGQPMAMFRTQHSSWQEQLALRWHGERRVTCCTAPGSSKATGLGAEAHHAASPTAQPTCPRFYYLFMKTTISLPCW
jgi:hypothetical protein